MRINKTIAPKREEVILEHGAGAWYGRFDTWRGESD